MPTWSRTPRLAPRVRATVTAGVVGTIVLGLAAMAAGPALAQEPPFVRGIDAACRTSDQVVDPFEDVGPDATHAAAIECLWVYGIASGRTLDNGVVYAPREPVTRQQMASFVARMLDQVPDRFFVLPETDEVTGYADDAAMSTAHRASIDQLTDAGILVGYPDGTFRPTQTLDRAQMASFIVRAIEAVLDDVLPRAAVFPDATGVHAPAIEKLAAIGVTGGRADGSYGPSDPITRAQMASFLARSLDHLVDAGRFQPLSVDPGTGAILGLTDVATGVQAAADRVTFTLEGDDDLAGWRVQYVDQPFAMGSGEPVEIAGDAVIEVMLTGMGIPPDLPPDVQEDLVEIGAELTVDGDAIVEVVIGTIFEGQQQIFIGTTGLRPFEVTRLADPQRVYVDVAHPE